jgi:hypothetical protein
MIRRVLLLLIVGVAFAAAVIFGLDRARVSEGDLSVAPERLALVPSVPEAPSSVQVRLVLPTAAMSEALDRSMPGDHRIAGRQRVCVNLEEKVRDSVGNQIGGDLGRLLGELAGQVAREAAGTQSGSLCQDVDYDVTIRKAGRPTVRSTGRTLEFVVPIGVEGRVGVPGELARSLGFDARAFRGAMDAIARVSADLDRNWCPRLTAEGDFRWTDRAQLEIVDGYWVDIDQPAGLELRRRIEQGIAALDGLVTCAMVRDAIASEWREIDLALPVPDMGEDLAHLHFRPTGAGFSGIDYGQEAIAAAIQIDGVTELRTGAPPATARQLDLPPLERIDATANRIDINLPVRLGYDRLVAELNSQFAGRTFTGRTPAGEARVTVEEVTLYPSGDRLAAGLRFTAGHDSRALGASGWAYLAARPVLSDDGRTIRLEDVALTRQLDNDLWSLLSGIFNDQIAAQIARSAVFPLDDAIATAKRQLAAALVQLEGETGIRVALEDPDIALTALVPAAEALEAVARFRTRAEVTVLSLR